MARYIGPKTRIARRFKDPIFGPDKSFERKNYPPGQHGPSKRKKKVSEYGLQLDEKQKTKFIYGILERQFAKTFQTAQRKKGITGEVLIQLLESRLDNVVYRLGIANSRSAARQLISHKHVVVNGKTTNISSYSLRPGDVISVRERSKSLEIITNSLVSRTNNFSWLEWNSSEMSGKFLSIPDRSAIPENIKEQLIVELYSK